jgi:hypothetical protein
MHVNLIFVYYMEKVHHSLTYLIYNTYYQMRLLSVHSVLLICILCYYVFLSIIVLKSRYFRAYETVSENLSLTEK